MATPVSLSIISKCHKIIHSSSGFSFHELFIPPLRRRELPRGKRWHMDRDSSCTWQKRKEKGEGEERVCITAT